MLDKLDESLIKEAIQKTAEKVDLIILDWKGLGQNKERIMNMLKNLNLKFERSDSLSKS